MCWSVAGLVQPGIDAHLAWTRGHSHAAVNADMVGRTALASNSATARLAKRSVTTGLLSHLREAQNCVDQPLRAGLGS